MKNKIGEISAMLETCDKYTIDTIYRIVCKHQTRKSLIRSILLERFR